MKVRIHDRSTNPPRVYVVTDAEQCRDATDRSAYESAFETGQVVTMGSVIAVPLPSDFATLGKVERIAAYALDELRGVLIQLEQDKSTDSTRRALDPVCQKIGSILNAARDARGPDATQTVVDLGRRR